VADKDYYSFDEVLNDLKLEEDELKRLVSAGEIRAFRDKNTMRFKAEDVARLRGGEVAPQDVELDDLELELEEDTDLGTRPASAPAAGGLDFDEITGSEELVLEETSATGEVIDLGGDEPEPAAAASVRSERVGAGARKSARVATVTVAEPVETVTEGGAMLVLMLAGVLLLVVANFLVLDAAVGRASSALTRAVANMFS
jgi:hypothetical protein